MTNCKNCGSTNVARRATFCSLSCATKFNNHRLGKRLTKEQSLKGNRNRKAPDHKTNVLIWAKTQKGKNKTPKSIYSMSSRTRLKTIKRLELSCFLCGWDRTVCDLHHIDGRKQENPHRHSNLTYLCPNCHRLAHLRLLNCQLPTFESVVGDRWLSAYFG